jgi:ADP-ribosylglycohydrolase
MLGGAVGDALGAGVRHWSRMEVQHRLGSRGVRDYLPVFGERGACTELTQLTVFTLEALLRAKVSNRDTADWLPTPAVRTNHLRWLYTQGVPWEYAMSGYLPAHPQPSGWLLERPELFSTRNPAGGALAGLGRLAMLAPTETAYDPRSWPAVRPGFAECVPWAAPAMVWESSDEIAFAAAADIAQLLTDDRDVQIAAGLHAAVLGKLVREGVGLWEAVSVSEAQWLQSPATGVRRAVHGAMFLTRDGRCPGQEEMDAEFNIDAEPGEFGVALASVAATGSFADAVVMAVNQSADSSVTGALTGQLAGAVYGPQGIPLGWLRELELLEVIETLCSDAAQAFAPPPPPPPLPKWAQRYVTDHNYGFSGPLELTSPAEADLATPTPAEPPIETTVDSVMTTVTGLSTVPGTQGGPQEYPSIEPDIVIESEEAAVPGPVVDSPAVDIPAEFTEPTELTEITEPVASEQDGGTWFDDESAPDLTFSEPVDDDFAAVAPAIEEIADQPATAEEDEPTVGWVAESTDDPAADDGLDRLPPSLTERILGCFLGGALGDALGSDLEFESADEISRRFGPDGPRGLREAYGVHGAITDDTQMTLFTAEGLIRGSVARRNHGVEDPLPEIQLAYQRWLHTQGVEWDRAVGAFQGDSPEPDGWLVGVPQLHSTRAPGRTVFRALAAFGHGEPAGSLTRRINDSKGCGGVMRSAPIALYSSDPAKVFELAARAAALTHSHPSGYLSAGALAVIVQQALLGQDLDDGVWLALQVLETWEGHDETSTMLKVAVDLAAQGVPSPDRIAEVLGGGWVGEQALAIAVCAALIGGDDIELALRTAVHHSGDSDSTGAVCGNIMGALVGIGGLPMDWLAELELREVIEGVALDCIAEFGAGEFVPGDSEHPQPTDEDWNRRYPGRPLLGPETVSASHTEVLPAVVEPPVAAGDEVPPEIPEPEPPNAEQSTMDHIGRFPDPPEAPASTGVGQSSWSQRPIRDRDIFGMDPPAPRPAPRRINGIVNYGEH